MSASEEIDADICHQTVHVVIHHDAYGKRLAAHECAVEKTELSVYPAARRTIASHFANHKQLSQITTYHWPVLKVEDYAHLMHKESQNTPGTDLGAFFVNGYALVLSPPPAPSTTPVNDDEEPSAETESQTRRTEESHTDVIDLLQLEEKVVWSNGWVFSTSVREQTVKIVASFSIEAMSLSEAILLMPSTGQFAQELYQVLLRDKNRRLSIPAPPPMKRGAMEAEALSNAFQALRETGAKAQHDARQVARVMNSFGAYVSRDDPQLKQRLEQRRKQLEESFHVLPLVISEGGGGAAHDSTGKTELESLGRGFPWGGETPLRRYDKVYEDGVDAEDW